MVRTSYTYGGIFVMAIGVFMIITVMAFHLIVLKDPTFTYLRDMFTLTSFQASIDNPAMTWVLMMFWGGLIMIILGSVILVSHVTMINGRLRMR